MVGFPAEKDFGVEVNLLHVRAGIKLDFRPKRISTRNSRHVRAAHVKYKNYLRERAQVVYI
jgi:hypothetical protein